MAKMVFPVLAIFRVMLLVQGFIEHRLETTSPLPPRSRILTYTPVTEIPLQPTTMESRIFDLADYLCNETQRKYWVFLIYNYLHDGKGYNEFLEKFLAKPMAATLCKRRKRDLLNAWLLELYDSNGDEIIDDNEERHYDKIFTEKFTRHLENRKTRRKRHKRKLRHMKSRRIYKVVRGEDR